MNAESMDILKMELMFAYNVNISRMKNVGMKVKCFPEVIILKQKSNLIRA